jgi:hypothetical protein
MKKKQISFLEQYLELKSEIEEKYGIRRPDPTAIVSYYLFTYTKIKEPRAIHRLLEVRLDQILDRFCKMGLIILPPKEPNIFAKKKPIRSDQFTLDMDVVPAQDVQKTDEEKLMGFMLS